MAKNSNKRQRTRGDDWKRKPSRQNKHNIQDKREQQARAVSLCPVCGTSTLLSKHNRGASYCPSCSLFFLNSDGKKVESSLTDSLKTVRELGGISFLFNKRVIGIVKCLSPEMTDGELSVLRHLTSPELKVSVDTIRNDAEIDSAEIDFFSSKTGLDRRTVISVFNSFREVIGKSKFQEDSAVTPNKSLFISFSASVKEVSQGEKVKISWIMVNNPKYSYVFQVADLSPKTVKAESYAWVPINEKTKVSLKIVYKGMVIETKEIEITLAEPPEILSFSSNLPSPIIESHAVTLKWISNNAEKLTIVHKYNDYEHLSVDVTQNNGELTFNVFRSELIELIAERKNQSVHQTLMIEVIPLPKFKSADIPNLIMFPGQDFAKIPIISQDKKLSLLMDYLRDSSISSIDYQYLSISKHLKQLFKIAFNAIRF